MHQELDTLFTSMMETMMQAINNIGCKGGGNQPPHSSSQVSAEQVSSYSQNSMDSIVKGMKLELPKFNGVDVRGWLSKATRFFNYHKVPDEERLTIAAFALEDKAFEWY